MLPGHRHRHREGQEGPVRAHRRRRRGGHRPRRLRRPTSTPTCATRRWRRSTCGTRSTPGPTCRPRSRSPRSTATPTSSCSWPRAAARPTRATCSRRPRRCSTRRALLTLPRREAAHARHRGLPAVPPRRRHRRHVGRDRPQDGQAGLGPLPRHAAHRRATTLGHGFRDLELEAEVLALTQAVRHRRPVRRQVLLPRRARDPPAPPRRLVPGRHRGVVLGRPPGAGQDHRRRRLPRAARDATRRSTCPRSPTSTCPTTSCASTSTGRWPRSAPSCRSYPVQDPAVADRPDGRRPRHRPRQDQGAARRAARRMPAVPARPLRVLRRPGQDAGGLRVGLVRPHHRRAHGRLRRRSSRPPAAAS